MFELGATAKLRIAKNLAHLNPRLHVQHMYMHKSLIIVIDFC